MKAYAVRRYDCGSNGRKSCGTFPSRVKALEYLAGQQIAIYHHVGERVIIRPYDENILAPYDVWTCEERPYPYMRVDKVVGRTDVGVTDGRFGLGYYAPNGHVVFTKTVYEREEFEVDNGE